MNNQRMKQARNLDEGSRVIERISTLEDTRTKRRIATRPIEVTPPVTSSHPREKILRHEPQPLFTTTTFFLCGSFIVLLANLSTPVALIVLWCTARFQRYLFRINDSSSIRRHLLKDFLRTDTITAPLRKLPRSVQVEEHYWVNRRGMSLMTSILTPTDVPIQSVVCFCHGYTDFPTLTRSRELSRMTKKGIAVIMIEYEGHGRSDGALGLITDWDKMVDDCFEFFEQTVSKRFASVPTFLMGESMGGAVAYCLYKRDPRLFRGVVLVCPMCKIGDDCLPPQWVIDFFRKLAGPKGTTSNMGYLPIAPSEGLNIDFSIRPHKQAMLSAFPLEYGRKPRLATAREMLDVTIHISKDLKNFHAPMLIQHGSQDRMTDPQLSRNLYEESTSTDKTLKIYDGMLHSLLSGEFDENIDLVLGDSIEWILERSHNKTL